MLLLKKIKSLLSRPLAVLSRPFMAIPLLAVATPALADFNKANELMAKVATGLHGLAAITITVAVVWVGYKVLWNGKSLGDCSNIIIGAILIISGAELAALFVV